MDLSGPDSREYFAGNDRAWQFTVSVDGSVVDISGFTAKFTLARTVGGTAVISTESSPATATSDMTFDPTNGVFRILATAAAVASLSGTYAYQAQVSGNGETSTILHGYMTFRPNMNS